MSDDGRKLTRYEWMCARAGFLDLLLTCKNLNAYINPEQQRRIAAAWDVVRDPKDAPLKFFEAKASPIAMPSSAGAIPRVRIPGKPGWTGT